MLKPALRILGFVGLTWLLLGPGHLALIGCGGSDGGNNGTGEGGKTGSGSGGATSAGLGGNGAGTGGNDNPGTGGSNNPGAGGSSSPGTGGSKPGTGGTTTTGAGGGNPGTGGAAAGTGGKTGTGGTTGTAGAPGAGGQAGQGAFTLTSSVLPNNGTFPAVNTCAGAGTSPPLTWTAGPAGTQSYAVVLVDTSISRYHWAIWNMAPTVNSLPAALPAGASINIPVTALQAITGTATPVYQGPCPNGAVHTYVFTAYALNVATLPGVATGAMAQAVFNAIQSHVLASATLTGTSNAVRP